MGDLNELDMIAVLTGEKTLDDVLAAPAEEAPVPPTEPEPPAEPAPVEPEPVVLAKDGKHTIPFSHLEEARNEAAALKEQNRLLNEQLLAAQAQAKSAEVPPTVTAPEDGPSLEEEYPEVARAVEKIVAAKLAPLQQQVAATLAPVQEAAAKTAEEAHYGAVRAVYANFDAIRKDPTPLNDWIAQQPPLARMGYEFARDQGNTEQVVQLFTEFAKSQEPPSAPAAVTPDAAALAAAKVKGVKATPPVSLSDVPGATAASHDGAAALLDMSPTALMQKFANAPGSQNIMELLDRVV